MTGYSKLNYCSDWAAGSTLIAYKVIGKYLMVAANAVTTHDVPEWGIWAGPPAKLLKKMSQVYGVSVDYLIGNFPNVNKDSKQEHEITDYDELVDAINNYLEEYKRSKS